MTCEYHQLKVSVLRNLAAVKAKSAGQPTTEIRQYWNKQQCLDYLKDTPQSEPGLGLSTPPDEMEVMAPAHDFEMATRFLRVLSGSDDETNTFQLFDDKKLDPTLASWMHRKHSADTFKQFVAVQSKGVGIYVMVNRGDCKGRSAGNVVEVRAFFIDLDGSPWEPAAEMLQPHIRVESSPGRFHLYWLVSDCTLDQFKPIQQAIANQFNGDKQCVDLSRVLRLPGFLHQKKEPVQTKLIEANDFSKYTTQQVIDGLQLDMANVVQSTAIKQPKPTSAAPMLQKASTLAYEFTDPTTGEVLNLTTWAVQNPTFDIVAAVDPQYLIDNLKDGKQHIVCPFEDLHANTSPDMATFIANAAPPDYPSFTIHCCHEHCAGRDRLEFILAMLEKGLLSVDQLQITAPAAMELKRPKYSNYRADEIAALLVKQHLNPEEFRFNLHLMHLALAGHNGTLPDDSWIISRALGISEESWQELRTTLVRSGWQIVENGRIFNPTTLREYHTAQTLAMKQSKGGIERQRLKREREAYLMDSSRTPSRYPKADYRL